MPHALRISSEMLMFDWVGMSPGFSSALGGGGGGVLGAAVAVGATGGGGGSEAHAVARARVREERTIAAAYFIASSLAHRGPTGRGLYTSIAPQPSRRAPGGRALCNAPSSMCIPM